MAYKGPTNINCHICDTETEVSNYVEKLYCEGCKKTVELPKVITEHLAKRYIEKAI